MVSIILLFLSSFGLFLVFPQSASLQEYRLFTITTPTSSEHALLSEDMIRMRRSVETKTPWSIGLSVIDGNTLPSTYQGVATLQKLQREQEALLTFLRKIRTFARRFDRHLLSDIQNTIRKENVTDLLAILQYTTLAHERQRQLLAWRAKEFETKQFLLLRHAENLQASKQILFILEQDIARLARKTTVERSMLSDADMMLLEKYTQVFAEIAKAI